jgi:hypothetical protein
MSTVGLRVETSNSGRSRWWWSSDSGSDDATTYSVAYWDFFNKAGSLDGCGSWKNQLQSANLRP